MMYHAELQNEFLIDLVKTGSIRFGCFELKNGSTSPVYVDLRQLTSSPIALTRAGMLLAKEIQMRSPDYLGAIPYAGIPLAVSASIHSCIPMCYYRKERKPHGTGQLIEGGVRSGYGCCCGAPGCYPD